MTLGELQAAARLMPRSDCRETQFVAAGMLGKESALRLLRVRIEQILIMAEANGIDLDKLAAEMEAEWRGKQPASNVVTIGGSAK